MTKNQQALAAIHPDPFIERESSPLPPASLDVSVIIPCYMVEDYVEECVASVLAQESPYTVEVIAVDDGSPDRTGEILDRMAEYSPALKVIHQRNRGLSGARNAGIDESRGRWIVFVDSDDVLPTGALSALVGAGERHKVDVAWGGHTMVSEGGRLLPDRVSCPPERLFSREEGPVRLSGFAWGAAYRRELWEGLRFPEGYWYEDTVLVYALRARCSSSYCVGREVYLYRLNTKGITRSGRGNAKALDTYWVVPRLLCEMRRLGLPPGQTEFEQTLHQFGRMLFRRTQGLERGLVRLAFLCACDTLGEWFPKGRVRQPSSPHARLTELALRRRWFVFWTACEFTSWAVSGACRRAVSLARQAMGARFRRRDEPSRAQRFWG